MAPELFGRTAAKADPASLTAPLYEEIGRLKMELDWLKKNLVLSVDAMRKCIEPEHPQLGIKRQCELLGLNRSSWYYPAPAGESLANLQLMRLLDEQYLPTPFYGSRRLTE